MKRFKVGDKVKIRGDLISNRQYGTLTFWDNLMSTQLLGNVVEIIKEDVLDQYIAKVKCGHIWFITDEMIEGKVDDIMVRISDLKVGDKVRIVGRRTERMNGRGSMDKYLGTVMTVKSVYGTYVHMEEDGGIWYWYEEMFEGYAKPFELKPGMVVELRNGQERRVVETVNMGLVLAKCGIQKQQKCCELKNYNDNLENTGSLGHDFDIMTVYGLPKTVGQGGIVDFDLTTREILWKREEVKEVTMPELNDMLKQLGYGPVKIVE